ncbi:hypothetical protein HC928_21805 [bacterium]|nr:hypothetical protein [bacterium]
MALLKNLNLPRENSWYNPGNSEIVQFGCVIVPDTLSKKTLYFLFALALLPACAHLFFIFKYGVNFPFADQWDTPGWLFIHIAWDKLGWKDFIVQHNESRMLFSRLIFLGLAYLTKWNILYELLLTFLLTSIIAFSAYILSQLTLKENNLRRTLTLAIFSNLLIFSLTQYENFLWGFQVSILLSITCIVACLPITQLAIDFRWKFMASLMLCTVSTFTFANGLLSWFVVFPALFIPPTWRRTEVISRIPWIVAWGMGFGLNLLTYLSCLSMSSQPITLNLQRR